MDSMCCQQTGDSQNTRGEDVSQRETVKVATTQSVKNEKERLRFKRR